MTLKFSTMPKKKAQIKGTKKASEWRELKMLFQVGKQEQTCRGIPKAGSVLIICHSLVKLISFITKLEFFSQVVLPDLWFDDFNLIN